jgi:cysteinyl-tRNA synthetase
MHLPHLRIGGQGTARRAEGLFLANTLTKRLERFEPREECVVRLFTCGPSVYRMQHVGNYRTYLYEDVLHRYLEYLGYRVERLINYTDVEDKALEECRSRGISLEELTVPVEKRFRQDCRRLAIRLPDFIPRSSTSVQTAAHIANRLMDKGFAYRFDGDIFFDPLRFEGFGAIFGLDMRDWPTEKKRFDKDTYPGRRWNLGDFILWHGRCEGETVLWDTEVGVGRPSWNIQDPAMILKHLGARIDIACGGVDNLYRHHDYTRAVMEAYSGQTFAPFWLHGEHVLVEGEKMSKSAHNEVYPRDLFERGYTPAQIRLYLIDGHYREKLDLHEQGLRRSGERLERLSALTAPYRDAAGAADAPPDEELCRGFERHMNDDLDVRGAIDALIDSLERKRGGEANGGGVRRAIQRIDGVVGLGLAG